LLIVVAVVALLAAVAVPTFIDSIKKSRRSDAIAALNLIQVAQERWRSNRPAYSGELTAAANATPPGLGLSALSTSGYYDLSLTSATAIGYTVTATARDGGSQVNDGNCARLRVIVQGGNILYGSAASTGSTWNDAGDNRCWSR